MHLIFDAFSYPKAGNVASENEDAFSPDGHTETSAALFRAAVADGATQSFAAGLWARLLVQNYYECGFSRENLGDCLQPLQKSWHDSLTAKPLPWYAERKIQTGAFSTLLGLTLTGNENGGETCRWDCHAVGDSCLFQVRGQEMIQVFPLSTTGQFQANPHLLCSNLAGNRELHNHISQSSGQGQIDDVFLLATDLVAQCLLLLHEQHEPPWEVMREMPDLEAFTAWIEGVRCKNGIRTDDATLLRLMIIR